MNLCGASGNSVSSVCVCVYVCVRTMRSTVRNAKHKQKCVRLSHKIHTVRRVRLIDCVFVYVFSIDIYSYCRPPPAPAAAFHPRVRCCGRRERVKFSHKYTTTTTTLVYECVGGPVRGLCNIVVIIMCAVLFYNVVTARTRRHN